MKDFIVIEKGKKGKREIGQLYKGKTVRISVQRGGKKHDGSQRVRTGIYFYNGAARVISDSGYILMKYSVKDNRLYFEDSPKSADSYKISESAKDRMLSECICTSSKLLDWDMIEGVYKLVYDYDEQLYYIQFEVNAER